jgi:Ni/Fe-hydrogenase 1 B-type cytochrome subunit
MIPYHVYCGYVLTASLIVRWIWFFTGPPLSTWKDIVPHTDAQWKTFRQTIMFYMKGFRGDPPFYVGHSPFAGPVYLTFFVIASIQTIVGLILNQVPPLPSGEREPPYLLILTHDLGFYFIMIYIVAHISAVFFHEIKENRSIVSSMINGKKVFREEELERIENYVESLKEPE